MLKLDDGIGEVRDPGRQLRRGLAPPDRAKRDPDQAAKGGARTQAQVRYLGIRLY